MQKLTYYIDAFGAMHTTAIYRSGNKYYSDAKILVSLYKMSVQSSELRVCGVSYLGCLPGSPCIEVYILI